MDSQNNVQAGNLTGLAYDALCKLHETGLAHPEQPARLDVIINALAEESLASKLKMIAPHRATDEQLALAHKQWYIQRVKSDIREGKSVLSTGDTPLSAGSLDAALLSAGAGIAAVDAVVAGSVKNAFCAVRPPGHHACKARGMGFCIFNNLAIAVKYAQQEHKIKKILIVDFDVHHGNGTQEIFYEDPNVLFFSTHQWPLFPGTGSIEEDGSPNATGTTINCPIDAGAGSEEIIEAFEQRLVPAANKFKPEMVFISAGFDAHHDDAIAELKLENSDYSILTKIILKIAADHASDKVVSLLEGGYNLATLPEAVKCHVEAMTQRA